MRPRSNTRRKFGKVDGTRVVIRTVIGDDDPIFIYENLIYKRINEMFLERLIMDISVFEFIKPIIKMIRGKTHALKPDLRNCNRQFLAAMFKLLHALSSRIVKYAGLDRTHNIRKRFLNVTLFFS